MREFVKQLTSNLLRAGISITACPQVETVGKVALLAAEAFVSQQEKNESAGTAASDYEIGGIYPIDHKLRDLPLSIAAKSKWREHLMNFRKSYLEKQEWLILVGGSHGTKEECEAANSLNKERKAKIKIYPIPCFGGTAAKIFVSLRKASVSHLDPCLRCKKRQYPCRNLDAIVEKIRST
jgi:hypothetical protein